MASIKYGISNSKKGKDDDESAGPSKEEREGARWKLLADRSVGNTMEQAFPFLVSFWMCAVFVDVNEAAYWGWCYLASRAIYPIGFRLGLPFLLLSTLPGYACIFRLMWLVYAKSQAM